MLKGTIKKGSYYDSVTLMLLTREIMAMPGIRDASMVMGSRENLNVLRHAGMLPAGLEGAGSNDLLIVVEAGQAQDALAAIQAVDELLQRKQGDGGQEPQTRPKSMASALEMMPDATLALISIAGKYAAWEARKALEQNLHVMLFSDNVSLEEERSLKQMARKKELLMMGPDCGTAIINGIPLGFANVVPKGHIGMVGASGTGIQEVASIIGREGGGISHALGTGGRDLKKEIGGLSFIQAIQMLAADDASQVICLISKPPDKTVMPQVARAVKALQKPVVALFFDPDVVLPGVSGIHYARNLEEAALCALALSRGESQDSVRPALQQRKESVKKKAAKLANRLKGKYVRGLFSGGTLCTEAQLIFKQHGIETQSNAPLQSAFLLENIRESHGHAMIDMGSDEFTVGRPHPMIDFELRNKRILQEAGDGDVAVILLDVVLGHGAHMQPARELTPAIKAARESAPGICFVAAITGTRQDPQNLSQTQQLLEEAGVMLMPSMASAAQLCAYLIQTLQK